MVTVGRRGYCEDISGWLTGCSRATMTTTKRQSVRPRQPLRQVNTDSDEMMSTGTFGECVSCF